MKAPAFLISSSGVVTVYHNGKAHTVGTDHPNYSKVLATLNKQEGTAYSNLDKLLDVQQAVRVKFDRAGVANVRVENGQVFYGDEVIHGTVVDRILEFVQKGYDIAPLVKFVEKLYQNPSKKSVDNLYRFLEHNKMPITEDGNFLAYKRVRSDYKDFYSGKFDNSPGSVFSMPRNKVDDNDQVTCSTGGHVAALDYALNSYHAGEGRLVVVEVNPASCVAVPYDYGNQKMRVCEYKVLEEMTKEYRQEDLAKPDLDDDYVEDDEYDYEDDDDYYDDEEAEDFERYESDEMTAEEFYQKYKYYP